MSWVGRQLRASLVTRVQRDHRQSGRAFRRRRAVAAGTLAAGAVLLWASLSTPPGAARFYPLTLALAGCWTLGALLSGPLHAGWAPGRQQLRRPVLRPVALGLVLVAGFAGGALLVAQVPTMRGWVEDVLAFASAGSLPLVALVTVVNGVAEELFFRGGLFAAVGARHPVAVTTAVYTATTLVTGNPMLVLAAAVVGLVTGAQRRASGGVLAPALTHVTWSMGMLLLLPPLLSAAG